MVWLQVAGQVVSTYLTYSNGDSDGYSNYQKSRSSRMCTLLVPDQEPRWVRKSLTIIPTGTGKPLQLYVLEAIAWAPIKKYGWRIGRSVTESLVLHLPYISIVKDHILGGHTNLKPASEGCGRRPTRRRIQDLVEMELKLYPASPDTARWHGWNLKPTWWHQHESDLQILQRLRGSKTRIDRRLNGFQ